MRLLVWMLLTGVAVGQPTAQPTVAPTSSPTVAPTVTPTIDSPDPTTAPTLTPTTDTPEPTTAPVAETPEPTVTPTVAPVAVGTRRPTPRPSRRPTRVPTPVPPDFNYVYRCLFKIKFFCNCGLVFRKGSQCHVDTIFSRCILPTVGQGRSQVITETKKRYRLYCRPRMPPLSGQMAMGRPTPPMQRRPPRRGPGRLYIP